MSYVTQNFRLPSVYLLLSSRLKLLILLTHAYKHFLFYKFNYLYVSLPLFTHSALTFLPALYSIFFLSRVHVFSEDFYLKPLLNYITKFDRRLLIISLTTVLNLFMCQNLNVITFSIDKLFFLNNYFISIRIVFFSRKKSIYRPFFLWVFFMLSFYWFSFSNSLSLNVYYYFYLSSLDIYNFNNKSFFKIINL